MEYVEPPLDPNELINRISAHGRRDIKEIKEILHVINNFDFEGAIQTERERRLCFEKRSSECRKCGAKLGTPLPASVFIDVWAGMLYCDKCRFELFPELYESCEACGNPRLRGGQGHLCVHCNTPSIRHERIRVKGQNYRTSKRGLISDLTLSEWLLILNIYENKCAYCGEDFTDMDHIVPVEEGGGTTKLNVIPACGRCNNAKKKFSAADTMLHSFAHKSRVSFHETIEGITTQLFGTNQ